MTVTRIRFGGPAQGRDLHQDVVDFMQWLEAECGEVAHAVDFAGPADPIDRAAETANADGPKLTVRMKGC